MNLLAHAYFADGDADRIVGQFCGDFVRGSDLSAYSPGIQRGIRMHRLIDAFTDRHPAVLGVRPLFKPPLRRLAGVITDVVYDHCLALRWADYSQHDLEEYIVTVNSALLEHKVLVPDQMQSFIEFIIKNQVLKANQHFSGVELTLQRLAKRSKVFAALEHSPVVAEKNMRALQQSFDEFFPQLCRYVDELNQSGIGA